MRAIRRFVLAAWLSYRALFTWLNPWGYISTRIVAPIVLALLFGSLGQFTGQGAQRPAIGGALLAVALATVYGMALAINNERMFGTLELRILAPEGQLVSLVGKAIPHVVDGLLNGALTLVVASAAFGIPIGWDRVGPLLLIGCVAAVSCAGLGLVAAAVGVRTRDTFTAPNIADMLLTLLAGVFVAVERLPLGIDRLSFALPLRRSVDAALEFVTSGDLVTRLLYEDLLVGAAWGIVGYAALHVMFSQARRHATLQLM